MNVSPSELNGYCCGPPVFTQSRLNSGQSEKTSDNGCRTAEWRAHGHMSIHFAGYLGNVIL